MAGGRFDDLIPKARQAAPVAPMSAPGGEMPAGGRFADLIPQAKREPSPGMAESAVRGGLQGATFGFSDEIRGLQAAGGGSGVLGALRLGAEALAPSIVGTGGQEAYQAQRDAVRQADQAAQAENPYTYGAGEIAGGVATGLAAAGSGATLLRGGMSLPRAVGAGVVEGGAYGALYGAGNATENTAGEAGEGAITGAAIGAAVPVVGRAIGGAVSRAITPQSVAPERQALVDVLQREGVPISAGQRSGSKALQYMESFLGDAPLAGGQASRMVEAQGEAFTDAAMRRIGAGGRATPEALRGTRERLGKSFEQLAERNPMVADRQMAQELGTALREYDRVLPADQRQIVGNLADDIVSRLTANNGQLPGKEYQTIRSRLSRMSQNARQTDPEFSQAVRGMRDALDNAWTRSVSPEDAAAAARTRKQWGNLKTIERAASAGGEASASGMISPAQLRIAASQGAGNRGAYARGEGDFAELARAGQAIMTPLPNSGTAQRNMTTGIFGGAGAGVALGEPMTAAIMALGPAGMGRALWAGPVQKYLSNQALTASERKALETRLRSALQGGAQSQSPRLSGSDR